MVQSGQRLEIPDPTGKHEILWNANEEEIEMEDVINTRYNLPISDLGLSAISDLPKYQPISIPARFQYKCSPQNSTGNQPPQPVDVALSSGFRLNAS
jgi:hypothetical protein